MSARADPKEREKGRLESVLEDPKVRDWHKEKSLRSRLAADTYARSLSAICERMELTPEEIVSVARRNPDKLRAKLTACATQLKSEGRLDSYVSKLFEPTKAYLRFRHAEADVFPRLSATKGESLTKERAPTQEELGAILEHLSLRGRVVALLMAHSGLRPGAIGSYGGEYGLRLQDLPGLRLGKEMSFKESPFVIRVPAQVSKTRTAYTTFGTSQLATALIAYLGERVARGEKLSPSSPVIVAGDLRGASLVSRKESEYGRGFLCTNAVVRDIRVALQACLPEGVTWRPYVLRSYCSTRLLMAEGAGKMTRDLREAILGHDLGISGRYNLGKPWGEEILKEARAQYKRAASFLETNGSPGPSTDEIQREAAVLLLTGFRGLTEAEARHMVEGKSGSELANLLKSMGGPAAPEKRTEKAVPVEDVPKMLEAGWEFVSPLNGSMAVLRAPQSHG